MGRSAGIGTAAYAWAQERAPERARREREGRRWLFRFEHDRLARLFYFYSCFCFTFIFYFDFHCRWRRHGFLRLRFHDGIIRFVEDEDRVFVGAVEIALRLDGTQVCGDAFRVELHGLGTLEDEQPVEI